MAKGFGTRKQSDQQIIRSITSSHYWFTELDVVDSVAEQRSSWQSVYLNKKYEKPAQPLSSYATEFSYQLHPGLQSCSSADNHQLVLLAQKGFWYLVIHKDGSHYDFTVGTIVGECHRFHPEGIKKSFHQWYLDKTVADQEYLQWKQMVLADLDSARFLIASFDPPCHMLSVTCNESSERLCRKLGFYVKDGIDFWLKGSDAFNNIVPFQRKVSIPPRASRMSMMGV